MTPNQKTTAKPKKATKKSAVYKSIYLKTSDGETFQGKINIAGCDRLSDFFARTDNPFIVVVDVERKHGRCDTLIFNKNYIIWAEPED